MQMNAYLAPSAALNFNDLGKENGWGGRDRTYECRYQKAVPYHLATPQQSALYSAAILYVKGREAHFYLCAPFVASASQIALPSKSAAE